jgi:salicylate biosynthesis isochorismate synthase/menaquinone-specific isochorismate synthase
MAPVLAESALAPLRTRVERAVRRARRRGDEVLASVTVRLDPSVDPSAAVFASRRPGEPWFCFEQPDRQGSALATLGCVKALEASGSGRFDAVAAAWRALVTDAEGDPPEGPGASGPVAVGGFSFAPAGGAAPHWAGFAPASLHVPEVALARRDGDVRLTVAVLASPDDTADELVARAERRLNELRVDVPLPLLDPDPAERSRVVSTMPPEHYEDAVARAVERIRAGQFSKIVLAREVQVHGGAPPTRPRSTASCATPSRPASSSAPAAATPRSSPPRPSCWSAATGCARARWRSPARPPQRRPGGRRPPRRAAPALVEGPRGARHRRLADRPRAAPARGVGDRGARSPASCASRTSSISPRPIRAQLHTPMPAVELAGLLHPTPAVGGEPLAAAAPVIPRLEGLDRGWYAGPVGWTDANEDGEFCVALRCALLRGPSARCYAGVGVVADSDPEAELAETEIKLAALLPVLAS